MESSHNTSKNNNNNLWIGELDQQMDENYLKESCQNYSKKKNIFNNLYF
jgi:hypothetical protein